MDFLLDHYLWVKAVHIIFVIFWMAGLFMMPRYLAYQMQSEIGSDEDKRWCERSLRLQRIILNPAFIVTWILGLLLSALLGAGAGPWLWVKFFIVIGLSVFHMACARWRRQMSEGTRTKSEKFFRIMNEVPAIAIILIVCLAVAKPF